MMARPGTRMMGSSPKDICAGRKPRHPLPRRALPGVPDTARRSGTDRDETARSGAAPPSLAAPSSEEGASDSEPLAGAAAWPSGSTEGMPRSRRALALARACSQPCFSRVPYLGERKMGKEQGGGEGGVLAGAASRAAGRLRCIHTRAVGPRAQGR
jgi:hypothetical protein